MFIATNRFKVVKGKEEPFETLWQSRRSRLGEMPGFIEFALLRGPERPDHRLYVSHTVWKSEGHFSNWTRSEQFRDAHKHAGQGEPMTLGHPDFEGFEALQRLGGAVEV